MVTWLLFLAAAYAAFAFATCLSKRKRLSGFGAIVPFEERAGAAASHGSRIELSPSEALLLKTGAVLSGLYKVALMVTVEERVPRRAIQAAAAALAARHPALRCKAVVVPPGPITSSSRVALEVDESIQLPLAFHECSEAATLTDAATAVWRSVEKRATVPGVALWRVDVVTAPMCGDIGTVFLLSESHACSDGISLQALAHELLCSICCNMYPGDSHRASGTSPGPEPEQRWRAPADVAILPGGPRMVWRTLRRLIQVFKRVTLPLHPVVVPLQRADWTIQRMADECCMFLRHHTLSEADTKRVHALCRQHGTTVTALATALVSFACTRYVRCARGDVASVSVKKRIVALFPVDMRGRVSPAYPTDYLAAVAGSMFCARPCALEEGAAPATAESIWASAVAWRHVIATNLDAELPWVTHLFASRVLAAQLLDPAHTLPRKDGTLLVSSWGKEVIQRQYDDPQTGASLRVRSALPAANGVAAFFVGCVVTSAAGRLTFTLSGPVTDLSDDKACAVMLQLDGLVREALAALLPP